MGRIFCGLSIAERQEEAQMLTQDQWTTIQTLRRQGQSIRGIARDLGLARNTVKAALRQPKAPTGQRARRGSRVLGPWLDQLPALALAVAFNAQRVFQDLRAAGYAGSYRQVQRAVQPWREAHHAEAVVRYETPPGKQGQVDFGSTWVWLGEQRTRVHCFVMTLGYSRRAYVEWVLDEGLATLLACHHHAFEHFGGMPAELLYDNPKTIVKRHGEDGRVLEWHPVLADALGYYGVTPRACRVYRAQTKGKVESGIKYVKRNFLPNRTFSSLVDLNAQTAAWNATIADVRVHGTTHQRPVARFRDEQAALLPLGSRLRYVISTPAGRKVARDGYVEYQANRYSVPPRLVGQGVSVRARPGGWVEVEHRGEVVARHRELQGRHQWSQDPAHRPTFPERTPAGPPEPPVVIRPLSVYEEVARG